LEALLQREHKASAALKSLMASAGNRRISLFYFYEKEENKSSPRAFHSYPTIRTIHIMVRENQLPWDEYLSIAFELMNIRNQEAFSQLAAEALVGLLTKESYSLKSLELEFQAQKRLLEWFLPLKPKNDEEFKSESFNILNDSSDTFDLFLEKLKKSEAGRNVIEHTKKRYDIIRNPGAK